MQPFHQINTANIKKRNWSHVASEDYQPNDIKVASYLTTEVPSASARTLATSDRTKTFALQSVPSLPPASFSTFTSTTSASTSTPSSSTSTLIYSTSTSSPAPFAASWKGKANTLPQAGVSPCQQCNINHDRCDLQRPCSGCASRGIQCVATSSSLPVSSLSATNGNVVDLTLSESEEEAAPKLGPELGPELGKFVEHANFRNPLNSTSSSDNENYAAISETAFLSASEHRHGSSNVQVVVPSRALVLAKKKANRKTMRRLGRIRGPPVILSNDVDDSTLPDNFHFIDDYVFSEGTQRLEEEFQSGCQCPQDYRGVGCEYLKCSCLEDVAMNEDGSKMGFPYSSGKRIKGLLRHKWLNTRHMIYECNNKCNCPPECKNKVVQNGRQIPLEIFRTRNRGWGLRSPVAIRQGQFIDTYRGEIITDGEATRRELRAGKGKDSYLFSLDKFQGEEGSPDHIANEDLYVVDGEFMGGPTRFMNHSCDPNCRQFTVSLTRGDIKVYELPFFAIQDIPAGTELTFDYMDDDDDAPISDEKAMAIWRERGQQPVLCLCGAENCRRYLWL